MIIPAHEGTVYEHVAEEMPVMGPSCGVDGGCGPCGGCNDQHCGGRCLIGCPRLSWSNMQFFFGAHGFLGPRYLQMPDRANDASFGFHGGANWGFNLPCSKHNYLSGQLGAAYYGSNYSGATFTPSKRSQTFITGGLFRRVDWGLQGGVVLDYLHDDWYSQAELIQLRAELSWVYPSGFEFGFTAAGSTRINVSEATVNDLNSTTSMTFDEAREAINTYRFFVRQKFKRGGEGRIFAGWSNEGDGIFGADALLPICATWAVQTDFAYLAPKGDEDYPVNAIDESWNVAVSLVWYPGGFDTVMKRYDRPLFNVADNGSFMQTRYRP